MQSRAAQILEGCKSKGIMLATAESCTGGMIAALFTDIPGSSSVFERGFVTYSNTSKIELLGIDAELIAEYGAVSSQVASAMAHGALTRSKVELSVAVTGIAGPDGGTAIKPVGTVFIAVAARDNNEVQEYHFNGDRAEVRQQSVNKALEMLEAAISRSFSSVA